MTDLNTRPVIVPCADYDPQTVRTALSTALEQLGGLDWVRPGMRIGLKLNLCAAAKPEKAATTHYAMAGELAKLLHERGAAVVLGDSPGEPFTAVVMNRVYSLGGYSELETEGIELNRNYEYEEVEFPAGVSVKKFTCCRWLLDCDAVINFSKLKSHGLMGMTAAVKNLYGIVPGTMKSEYHFQHQDPMNFANMLVDFNEYLKPVLNLCDAVEIMEGNGPTQGTPRHLGLLLASASPYELDRAAAKILGIRESEIPFMIAAEQRGLFQSDEKDYDELCAPLLLADFERSGATSGWFATGENDPVVRKVLKKALYLLLSSRPVVTPGCTGCGHCVRGCPANAITIDKNRKAVIQRSKCVRCFCCQEFCPSGAMKVQRSPVARLITK